MLLMFHSERRRSIAINKLKPKSFKPLDRRLTVRINRTISGNGESAKPNNLLTENSVEDVDESNHSKSNYSIYDDSGDYSKKLVSEA